MEEEDRPILAFILSLLAGILIFVEGVLVLFGASIASSLGLSSAAALLTGIGILGAFFGFLIVILAILLLLNPESHLGCGIAILVFSLLGFFVGGGFVIGSILGLIGGILAIVFAPYEDPTLETTPEWSAAGPQGFRRCPFCEASMSAHASFCPECGRPSPPA